MTNDVSGPVDPRSCIHTIIYSMVTSLIGYGFWFSELARVIHEEMARETSRVLRFHLELYYCKIFMSIGAFQKPWGSLENRRKRWPPSLIFK